MNLVDNIFKGIVTSIIGTIALCAGGYGYYINKLTGQQALGLAVGGIILIFVKDRISEFVGQIFTKWLGKSDTPAAPK